MKKLILPITLLIAVVVISVVAKEKMDMKHSQHSMSHAQHTTQSKGMPQEFGDAGFAAIAEIVALLSNDPDTDWAKVNINGLREHLVMMNQLVTGAKVDEQVITDGRRFTISGTDTVLKAIQQMVPAHAVELDKMSEYSASSILTDEGAILEITSKNGAMNTKIKGLGFFGLMATGSHHQMHHLMMATGRGHH